MGGVPRSGKRGCQPPTFEMLFNAETQRGKGAGRGRVLLVCAALINVFMDGSGTFPSA